MRTKGWWLGSLLLFALAFWGSSPSRAGEKTHSADADGAGSGEMEEGSGASADDGMAESRFGEDEDDTYTDDSDHLDDLSRSKFNDEKEDDDQGADDDGD